MEDARIDPLPGRLALHVAGATLRDGRRLAARFGDWRAVSADDWRRAGLAEGLVRRLSRVLEQGLGEREAERCRELGIRLVAPEEPDAPVGLGHLHRPPLLLAVRGRWPPPEDTLAVVGARAASAYGCHVARALGRLAVRCGWVVASGLARGVDRHVLEACHDRGGWGLAVLGTGLDVAYPRQNRALQDALARGGTVVSEFALGTRPDRWTFPRRNRILAALARAVVVVEAGPRSGALITAQHGLELGRDVFAVPGPIDGEASRGCNRLLADGATPLWDLDVFAELLRENRESTAAVRPQADPLLASLERSPATADELAGQLGEPVSTVRARLLALELEGAVERLAGSRYTPR